jgi:hypothetical protein
MKISKKVTYLTILLTLIAGAELASAKQKPRNSIPVTQNTYTVIHAIPLGFGADVVDIYSDFDHR